MSGGNARDAAFAALGAEILAEQAASLAAAGRRLEGALAALAAAEPGSAERPALLAAAQAATWALVVQRDACGFHDAEAVLTTYGVPREVSALVVPPPLTRWRPRRK